MVIEANLIQLELPSKDLAAKDMVVAESVDLTLMLKSYQERPICRECSLPLVRHGLFNSDNFLSSQIIYQDPSGFLVGILKDESLIKRWEQVADLNIRYMHPENGLLHDGPTTLRYGPVHSPEVWGRPLLMAMYVLGFSSGQIVKIVDANFGKIATNPSSILRNSSAEVSAEAYRREMVKDLHRKNRVKFKPTFLTGGWTNIKTEDLSTIGWKVEIEGLVTRPTLRFLKELSISSAARLRQGTLSLETHLVPSS